MLGLASSRSNSSFHTSKPRPHSKSQVHPRVQACGLVKNPHVSRQINHLRNSSKPTLNLSRNFSHIPSDFSEKQDSFDSLVPSAVNIDDRNMVKHLCENGADPFNPKWNAVKKATKLKNFAILEFFLKYPRYTREQFNEAFEFAIASNNIEAVKIFIKNGVNVNKQKDGTRVQAPLVTALKLNREAIAKLLIAHKADVNAFNLYDADYDFYLDSPSMAAAESGNVRLMSLLIENGAQFWRARKRMNSDTVLTSAIYEGHIYMTCYLLSLTSPAFVAIRNEDGEDALSLCKIQGWHNIIKLIEDKIRNTPQLNSLIEEKPL